MKTENLAFKVGQYEGQGIAVVTSGGDSQGMNPALRAVVRIGLYLGCKIFYIREGFQGMLDGNIVEATWGSVSSIIHKVRERLKYSWKKKKKNWSIRASGTIIGSARCKDFMTLEGKLKCCKNLVERGISNLIIIGGDGSLTGARDLKHMWLDLQDKLVKSGDITKQQADKYDSLKIVGLVGTIDNDFPGTDMTIGADSALHRILEAVNAITSTALSHKRTFILEVMGRHCGYLALKTGLTTEADYLFIPEMPPVIEWPNELEKKIKVNLSVGKRLNLIVLAEGAIDVNGEPITASLVKSKVEKLGLDSRVTVLGHVQRGGSPSAYDRILGSRSGAEAVIALMEMKSDDKPVVIAVEANVLKRIDLDTCINNIYTYRKLFESRDYKAVLDMRGSNFIRNFEVFRALNQLNPISHSTRYQSRTLAILQIGTPACGMNAAVYSFVRHCMHRNGKVYGIKGGVEGLLCGHFDEIKWSDTNGLIFEGGSILGTKRMIPIDDMYPKIAESLRKFKIEGLLIVGGFEAFTTAYNFMQKRANYPELCIPMAVIPATVNNNVPGSDFSIGVDTALNTITRTCDLFRQSAMGTQSRVFVVETMGGKCGYLCSVGALASGADSSYIYEEPFDIDDMSRDVRHMISKMKYGGVLRGLVLRNEECNKNYTIDFITKLFSEEGKHEFTTRKNVLGHIQQGDIPTSFDRSLAVKMSETAVRWFYERFEKGQTKDGKIFDETSDSVVVIGLYGNEYCRTNVEKLLPYTDFENRDSKCKWWMKLRNLFKILALHESNYDDNQTK